jgi:methylglutaconyl-CoA hydratase
VRRYALTAERFDAHEARRIGLVHEIVPLAELEEAGMRIVEQLLANGPEAIAQTKSLALQSAWADIGASKLDKLIEIHAQKRQSSEAAEGLTAFSKKRGPSWQPS